MAEAVVPLVKPKNVRKWRRMLLALADPSVDVPATFFDALTFKPTTLPAGAKEMGFVTTDGITVADSLSSENTSMLQSLTPVRRDLTGREQSVSVVFGEANAWVNALFHGLPVADWPTEKEGPWLFDDGDVTDWPDYRLWLIGQDGLGDRAVYRVEFAYKAGITAKTDRVLGSAAETFGCTFGCFLDDEVGLSYTRGQNGVGLNPPAGG